MIHNARYMPACISWWCIVRFIVCGVIQMNGTLQQITLGRAEDLLVYNGNLALDGGDSI